MPKIQNSVFKRNLQGYRVWIEDTNPISDYFQLKLIPDILTAGKNVIVMAGSSYLEPTTEVLVEILDINGATVFLRPIKNYLEGLSRVISVEVYQDTPPGPATLTILGYIMQDINGNKPPVDFHGGYNVRYTKQIIIDPSLQNISTIRLLRSSQIAIQEIIVPARKMETPRLIIKEYPEI